MQSRTPTCASGANAHDNDGWRASQSTSRTCAPPLASSAAIDAATLDFPSLGKHDIRPTVRLEPASSLSKSRPSLSERMDSEYSDPGTSMIDCKSCGTVEILRG